MSVLVIEVGSGQIAAAVADRDGNSATQGSHGLTQHSPRAGWVEYSPDEIWRATLAASRTATEGVARDVIQGITITITNQGDTLLLWDRETLGSPRPAIAGSDCRATEVCARLRDAGHEDRVRELTELTLDPCLVGPKLSWLAEHEPNTWALVQDGRYAVGTVDSYLIARMTRGTWHVTDTTNATRTLLFDVERGEWSDELCALFGVPREALPDIAPTQSRLAVTDPRSFLGLEVSVSAIG